MAPVANFAALENKKAELIRKGLSGALFIAPITADTITTLTEAVATAQLNELPEDWDDVGYMTTDGLTIGASTESTDTTSWGASSPTRSDITGSTTTMAGTLQETKRLTIELATGSELIAVTAPASGEISIEMPERPAARYFRALGVAMDDGDAGEIYIATYFPRCKVTTLGDSVYSNSEITYAVTLTGYKDTTEGFARKLFWAGPGWLALLEEMGFATT